MPPITHPVAFNGEIRTFVKDFYRDDTAGYELNNDFSGVPTSPTLNVYSPTGINTTPGVTQRADGSWESDAVTLDEYGTWVLNWDATGADHPLLYTQERDYVLVTLEQSQLVGVPATVTGIQADTSTTLTNTNNIEGELLSPIDGLGAIKAQTQSIFNQTDSGVFGLAATKTELDTVDLNTTNTFNIVNDLTYGNAALLLAIQGIDLSSITSILNNGTYGLAALNADLDTLLARLSATRAGNLDDIPTTLAAVVAVNTILTDPTTGLPAILTAADILRPDNIKRKVTVGDANLPSKVEYKFKRSADATFAAPVVTVTMAFQDLAGQTKVVYEQDGLVP